MNPAVSPPDTTPSAAPESEGGTEPAGRGDTTVADRVVEKVAGRAAAEVDRAAAVPRHLLGKTVGRLHPQSRPHTSARVDGSTASVSVAISVRYPEPARAVAAEVRSGVIARVGELCGLDVVEVHVDVAHFHTPEQAQPTRRVR